MKNRRKFLMFLTTGFVAMAVIVGSAIADELIGYISKVDKEGKKITVVDKDDKETEVKVTADTEWVAKKVRPPRSTSRSSPSRSMAPRPRTRRASTSP